MRISAAALLVAACASAAPAPERAPDPCAAYGAAVREPLRRMGQAADRFGDHLAEGPAAAARASRELAAALDEERGRLGAVDPARADIADAHARMLAAVDELAGAMRFLGDALAARDETRREPARTRLRGAMERWRDGVEGIRRVCP